MNKLRPCPFCGCEQISIGYDPIRSNAFVYCDQCRAFGPNVSDNDIGIIAYTTEDVVTIRSAMTELAVELWNFRPMIKTERGE